MFEHRVRLGTSSEEAISVVSAELRQRGFFVVRTFDLHRATADLVSCPCPHHGTEACDCNYSTLLVYRSSNTATPTGLPSIISAHQRDGVTWLYLMPSPWSAADDAPDRATVVDAMVAAVFAVENEYPEEFA